MHRENAYALTGKASSLYTLPWSSYLQKKKNQIDTLYTKFENSVNDIFMFYFCAKDFSHAIRQLEKLVFCAFKHNPFRFLKVKIHQTNT